MTNTPRRQREQAQLTIVSTTREGFAWIKHTAARTDLTPIVKFVLVQLAHYRNARTGLINPAYATLGKGCGVSERTAMRASPRAKPSACSPSNAPKAATTRRPTSSP
jgi:hypothetical protein